METITQILNNFNTLSTYLFIFVTNIEPFTLLKEIPREVNDLINDVKLVRLQIILFSCLLKIVVEQMKNMNASVSTLTGEVEQLKEKPRKRWDGLVDKIIWFFASAILGFILATKIGI